MSFEAGDRVGRYLIVRLIGAGGMGEVYEARDHELDRSVALKIMPGTAQRMRLMREAQTLAQLQHPNVVTVYGLEVHGDRLCIAMELVDGETLDHHVERARPGWRAIVSLFVQAGRGLAAAHDKGIVHRDVKPSNLLVDASGRVRVGDFGLARQIEDGDGDAGSSDVRDTRALAETVDDARPDHETKAAPERGLTRTGAAVGTPLFMAPEQHLGERAVPASDQFGFCVALWLALFDIHPFDVEGGVAAAVTEGIRRPPPDRDVPRWLVRVLDRGLALDPAARFPSMTALLEQLEARPERRRRALALAAGATLLAGGAVAWAVVQGGAATGPVCPPPDAQIAAVWSPARANVVEARLAKIDPARGRERLATVTRASDGFVRSWRESHGDACAATRVRGEQSDAMLDARMRCLRGRLAELDGALARLAGAADAGAADGAIAELVQLAPPTTCADPSELGPELAFPLAPAARATADALLGELRKPNTLAEIRALLARARTLGHPPTLAKALARVSQVELGDDELAAGERTLRELTQVAAAAHDDREEAYAWIKLVQIVGGNRGKPAEGLALAPAARAAILRAGQPLDLRVDVLYAEAMVLGITSDVAQALAKLDEARGLLERAGADQPAAPYGSRLADVWLETGTARAQAANGGTGSFDDAVAAYRRSIALTRAQLGPDTVDESYAWVNMAESLKFAGKLADARKAADEALRIREARTGESLLVAAVLVTLGGIHGNGEAWRDALAAFDRALAIYRARLAPDDVQFASVLLGRAWVLGPLGRNDEELQGYSDVIALFDRAKASAPDLATALMNRAETTQRACRKTPAPTVADYTRAEAVFEQHFGATAPFLVAPLLGHGRCLVMAQRAVDAIPVLERGVAVAEAGSTLGAVMQYWLGRALTESGRDRTRGATLVRDARAQLAAAARTDKSAAAELADLEHPY